MLRTAGLITESLVFSSAIVAVLKRSFGRSRPYVDAGSREFSLFNPGKGEDHLSLPSGHTSTAFTVMTVIAKQYPQWWIKYPAYAFGFAVAMRRIEGRKHWASDVLFGGAIGYTVSNAVVERHGSEQSNSAMYPYFNGRTLGVIYKF